MPNNLQQYLKTGPSYIEERTDLSLGHINIINPTSSNSWGWTTAAPESQTWGSSDDLENINVVGS